MPVTVIVGIRDRAGAGGIKQAGNVQDAAGDRRGFQIQRRAIVDLHCAAGIGDGVAVEGERAGRQNRDGAGIGDGFVVELVAAAGGVKRAGVAQAAVLDNRRAGEMDGALVGDLAVIDGGVVEAQRAAAVDGDLPAGVLDAAAQIDGERAGRQNRDGAGIGDGFVVELVAAAGGVKRAGVAQAAVLDNRRAGEMDGAVVGDLAVIDGGVVEAQRAAAVDGDLPAGVLDAAAQIDGERAGRQNRDGAGIGDGFVVELVAAAGGVKRAGVAQAAVLDNRRAGEMDGAVVGDLALIDGGVVEAQRAAAVDGDLPAGVLDAAAQIDGERAGRQNRDGAGIGDGFVVELVAAAGGVKRAGVAQAAVLDNRRAGEMDGAVVGDLALIDGGVVEAQRAAAVDGDLPAGVLDAAAQIDGERAGRQNRDGAGIGDGFVVELVAAAGGVKRAGVAQAAVLDNRRAGEMDGAVRRLTWPCIDGARR